MDDELPAGVFARISYRSESSHLGPPDTRSGGSCHASQMMFLMVIPKMETSPAPRGNLMLDTGRFGSCGRIAATSNCWTELVPCAAMARLMVRIDFSNMFFN